MTDAVSPDRAAIGPGPVVRSIGEVRPQVRADVSGVIRSVRAVSIGGTPACSYTLADRTGALELLFLGRIHVAGLEQGRRSRAEGMVAIRDDRNVIWNPRYWIQPEDQADQADQADGVHDTAGEEPSSPAAAPTRSPPKRFSIDGLLAKVRMLAPSASQPQASTGIPDRR